MRPIFWLGTYYTASRYNQPLNVSMTSSQHVYEVRPRKDKRGFDLISDALPFGAFWYGEPNAISNAIGYAQFYSRSHRAVIRVYDEEGNLIETHEHAGEFKEFYRRPSLERGACITGVQPSVATLLPHLTAFPASQDRARIAFDWRMIK